MLYICFMNLVKSLRSYLNRSIIILCICCCRYDDDVVGISFAYHRQITLNASFSSAVFLLPFFIKIFFAQAGKIKDNSPSAVPNHMQLPSQMVYCNYNNYCCIVLVNSFNFVYKRDENSKLLHKLVIKYLLVSLKKYVRIRFI